MYVVTFSAIFPLWISSIILVKSLSRRLGPGMAWLKCVLLLRMWSILVRVPYELEKDFLLWDEVVCRWRSSVAGVVEVSYVFTDLPPAGVIHYRWRVLQSPAAIAVCLFLFAVPSVLPHLFSCSVSRHVHNKKAMSSWRTDSHVIMQCCFSPLYHSLSEVYST
jgi:hypothetical protein